MAPRAAADLGGVPSAPSGLSFPTFRPRLRVHRSGVPGAGVPGSGRGSFLRSPSLEDAPCRGGRAEGPPLPGSHYGVEHWLSALPGCIPGPGDNAAGPATAPERGDPPGAADAPRAGPRPSQPAGAQGGGTQASRAPLPAQTVAPTARPLAGALLRDTSRAGNLPCGGVGCVLACRGHRRCSPGHRCSSPGWPVWVVAPWQNPARLGVAEGSPPLAFAPAQSSPRSARPRDLRAAEQLQPPKRDRGWGWRWGEA